MAPLAAIDLDLTSAIAHMDSLERAVKASSTGALWVASRTRDHNCCQASLVKGLALMGPLVNRSIKLTSVPAHLVGREFYATLKWCPARTLLFAKDPPFPNFVVTAASVKISVTAIVVSALKVTRVVTVNTKSTSVIPLLVKMEPPAKILSAPTRAPVRLVSRVPIANTTSTTAIRIHARTVVSATTWSTPFPVLVRTAPWAFSVRSTSMNVSKEPAITAAPVSTRSVHSNVNVHLVLLDHVVKVTSMNVYPILARLLEP